MTLEIRLAVEALRAGVPNRAAIRLMGNEHTGIEEGFDAALQGAWASGARSGIGVAGGFGAGKSHLLGYLAEVARMQNFVVSRVVISKETPLANPAHVFNAAIRDAVLPDRNDDALAAALATLRTRPAELKLLEDAVSTPSVGFAPLFAAALFLLGRSATPADVVRAIERFFGGVRLPASVLRRALKEAGAARTFALGAVDAHDLALQRIAFAPLLFRAAGYAGWCILLDEVELIGRYTPLQRAMSYAWLASWLGLEGARPFPGIVALYAVTDDFVTAVINARLDSERLPERLVLKGRQNEARWARAGIAHIERTVLQHRLTPPTDADLAACHDRLRDLYAGAYGWPAPALPPLERTSSRTMRHYIKAWVTQWDMARLYGTSARMVEETLASNYQEDAELAAGAPPEDEDG
ncbi:MAG: DUF2791 family P-loop domain-containing protein [Rhodospirillales bacterium]|nr:DUF2791 family P-loop domain-containing protein [Rhodospirillales bacterium]